MSTRGNAETRYFGQSTCDESGFGVFAVVHAIIEPCTNGDDIFESTGQFDTNHVMGSVDTEVCGSEQGADAYSYIGFISGNNRGSWFPLCYFTCNVGATQCCKARMHTREFLFDNLGHTLEGANLDAFAGIDEQGLFANIGS